MEEFKRRAGIDILHVPYKGSSPNLTDVMAGNVLVALETAAAVQPLVQGGKLRALAAATSVRLPGVLAAPTFAESGFPNFLASTWLMVLYRAGTNPVLVQSTFAAVNTVMGEPGMDKALLQLGAQPRRSVSPAEASAYLRSEFQTWGDVVKRSGVVLE